MDSEEDLLVRVMTAAVVLQGIGDCVHENIVCRYCIYLEVAGHHIEPFL